MNLIMQSAGKLQFGLNLRRRKECPVTTAGSFHGVACPLRSTSTGEKHQTLVQKEICKRKPKPKRTAAGIRTWSPTVLLIRRFAA